MAAGWHVAGWSVGVHGHTVSMFAFGISLPHMFQESVADAWIGVAGPFYAWIGVAGCTNNQPRRVIRTPSRGHLCRPCLPVGRR